MITGLNHAVLYVRDARVHERFYGDVLGFQTITADEAGRFVFLRAPGSDNHHDIAFFSIGAGAQPSPAGPSATGDGTVGMYHLAWEVATIGDLAEVRTKLEAAGALVGASDHGVSKSLYAKDPDGLEFEVMYRVPAEHWGEAEHDAVIRPLDLDAELARWS